MNDSGSWRLSECGGVNAIGTAFKVFNPTHFVGLIEKVICADFKWHSLGEDGQKRDRGGIICYFTAKCTFIPFNIY